MAKLADILIPILMFCVPIFAAIASRKAEKRKRAARAMQHPEPAEEISMEEFIHSILEPEDYAEQQAAPEPPLTATPFQPVMPADAEGQHSITHRSKKRQDEPAKEKEKIDKRKLIIYSELLKPKFNEGLE